LAGRYAFSVSSDTRVQMIGNGKYQTDSVEKLFSYFHGGLEGINSARRVL
jgi:hypothetical protein